VSRRALLLLLAFLVPLSAAAQGPSAEWRTLRTPHFRVHYPASSEAWTRRAAARLESIRERVVAEVGYAPPEVVDVLVSDPVADPNGMAFPILGWPRMVLWTSPPGPESDLGHYRDWSEILIAHEETHLVHLLRPSRNPLRQGLARIAPVGPIGLTAPRWVTEGYATVIEGRLTGAGRPNSDLRAAVLRRWAQAGKLPTYARLASDRGSWRGMSMAYLLGSAYLEWLEERAGPGSLRKLWARMTARTPRGFDDAFRGVFGDAPTDLYDRFRAELTWRAMEAERRLGPETREGALWQDLSWTVGAPAIAPDGGRLVIELDRKDRPSRLVVVSTAPTSQDTEAAAKRRERIAEMLARDPEDVAPVEPKAPGRKPLHTLESHDGPEPTTPRFLADGASVLFVRFEPDPEGFLHPDLFRWTPESGAVLRLTRGADLRDPDPSPVASDPDWAVAVRNRDGASSVVRVDLRTGAVTAITEPSVEEVVDRPRIAPEGRRIAFARHREGSWRLVVRDLASGAEINLAPPAEGTVASPAWSPDGRTLYASVGDEGFVDLWAFAVDGGAPPRRLTRTQGAALSPAATPDGSALFYLSLESDGLDLRRWPLTPDPSPTALPTAGRGAPPPDLAPAVRPAAPIPPPPFAIAEVPPGRPYGLGRQEILPLLGGSAASSGSVVEAGLRSGDVVGRLEILALGSIGSDGWPSGGALAGAWRGWPVAVGFHVFDSRESPARDDLDLDRRGAELSGSWERLWSGGRLMLRAAALAEDVDPSLGENVRRTMGSLAGAWAGSRRQGGWRLDAGLGAHWEPGQTGGDSWQRYGGSARLALRHDDAGLTLSWRRDGSGGDPLRAFDAYQLGGSESSLLPRSATAALVAVPALPFGTLLGEEHEGQRAELRLGLLPAPLFYERHRLWTGGLRGRWLSLAGLEWRFALEPLPVGRVPGLDVRVGAARVLEEGDTRWWLTTVWRP
jgi:hypothetical protein